MQWFFESRLFDEVKGDGYRGSISMSPRLILALNDTSDLGEHGTEAICYRTAVVIEKIQTPTPIGNQPRERE